MATRRFFFVSSVATFQMSPVVDAYETSALVFGTGKVRKQTYSPHAFLPVMSVGDQGSGWFFQSFRDDRRCKADGAVGKVGNSIGQGLGEKDCCRIGLKR